MFNPIQKLTLDHLFRAVGGKASRWKKKFGTQSRLYGVETVRVRVARPLACRLVSPQLGRARRTAARGAVATTQRDS